MNPAVEIIKSIPGHPKGCIRYPGKAQREQWLKMGVARIAEEQRPQVRTRGD